jgi:hypothetical protein
MRLDASDFEAVWQYMCARALADHAQGTLIASFVLKGACYSSRSSVTEYFYNPQML